MAEFCAKWGVYEGIMAAAMKWAVPVPVMKK